MIDSAASNQLFSFKSFKAFGIALTIFSTGNFDIMSPVENDKTCLSFISRCFAKDLQTVFASSIPCWPIPAFAQPLLMTSALILSPCAR